MKYLYVVLQALHFMTYEWCQSMLNPARAYDPRAHALSGAAAGALAAAATTPLDVCKTVLNTQVTCFAGGMLLTQEMSRFYLMQTQTWPGYVGLSFGGFYKTRSQSKVYSPNLLQFFFISRIGKMVQ